HNVKYFSNIIKWYILMKQVAHAANEYSPRLLPFQRLTQLVRMQCHLERIIFWISIPPAKPFCHAPGVTVFATFRYGRTAGDGIPDGVRPFYPCLPHFLPPHLWEPPTPAPAESFNTAGAGEIIKAALPSGLPLLL